jgi:hypothetical protein
MSTAVATQTQRAIFGRPTGPERAPAAKLVTDRPGPVTSCSSDYSSDIFRSSATAVLGFVEIASSTSRVNQDRSGISAFWANQG